MSASQVPPILKPIAPYLIHAGHLEKADALMSYHCRYYAVQEGIKLRQSNPKDEASKKFLIQLMDKLEEIKRQLGNKLEDPDNNEPYVINFALRVFNMADNEDRAGKATKNTAKNFLSASQFFEVVKQFAPLTEDIVEKQKYAKWKAADINNALKQGLTPKPGPPIDDPDGEEQHELSPDPTRTAHNDIEHQTPSFPSFPSPPSTNNNEAHHQSSSPNFPQPPSYPQQPPAFSNNLFPQPPSYPQQPPAYPSGSTSPQAQPTPKASPSAQPASQPPQSHTTASSSSGHKPSEKDLQLAHKHAKFAVSSLDYEDTAAAIKYLKLALQQLTGKEPIV